jgi:hypothetical protein
MFRRPCTTQYHLPQYRDTYKWQLLPKYPLLATMIQMVVILNFITKQVKLTNFAMDLRAWIENNLFFLKMSLYKTPLAIYYKGPMTNSSWNAWYRSYWDDELMPYHWRTETRKEKYLTCTGISLHRKDLEHNNIGK